MTSFLTKTPVLWLLFGGFVLQSVCFGVIMAIWDFTVIDEMSDPEKVRGHIAAMSETQRHVHAWTTATLDVAYPLTYGALFAGLALTRFPSIWAAPAIAVIPVDLAEGVVQVMALLGNDQLIELKAILTPLKLVLFGIAAFIALAAFLLAVRSRLTSKPS
ncbi:MAG: hypothetical protein AAFZ74_04625 [Pseudomonadota bacterium]